MKKFLSLIIIFLATGLMTQAQILTANQFKNVISNKIVSEYRTYTDADLEVNIMTVPFTSMTLSDGQIFYKVSSNANKFMARDVKKVEIIVNGKVERVVMVPVQVKAYKSVLVASSPIDRGSSINLCNTRIQRKEVSNIINTVVTKEKLSKELTTKKMFREGEVIDMRFVTTRPEVARNQEVVAYFRSKGVMISISAKALSDARTGDYVMLQSDKFQKHYRGKVIGPNRVLISI